MKKLIVAIITIGIIALSGCSFLQTKGDTQQKIMEDLAKINAVVDVMNDTGSVVEVLFDESLSAEERQLIFLERLTEINQALEDLRAALKK